jgi:hypothetical protein
MNQGFTFEQVMALLTMIMGGLGSLYIVAQGLRSWTERKLKERDDAWGEEKKTMALTFAEQITNIIGLMKEDRAITAAALEKVHTRISERIEEDDYHREQQRVDAQLLRLAESIETLASSIRHRIDGLQQIVTTQVGLREAQSGAMQNLHEQQKVIIGLLAPPKQTSGVSSL